MIDNRIYTFLELCTSMNYHRTAENLNMTQPAVTQHIKHLENLYNAKLFNYSNKKLVKTKKGAELEKYAREIISLSFSAVEELSQKEKIQINIGATKTIGEYMLGRAVHSLLSREEFEVNLVIDNTENLLDGLNHFRLDILMLEGYLDKERHKHRKISDEEIVGICAKNHPFAFREVSMEEVFEEKVVLRENGSGTRAVFENFLKEQGYTAEAFKNKSVISSNKLIEDAVKNNYAISFVYDIIPKSNPDIASFRIREGKIMHELSYVFINESKAEKIIALLSEDAR